MGVTSVQLSQHPPCLRNPNPIIFSSHRDFWRCVTQAKVPFIASDVAFQSIDASERLTKQVNCALVWIAVPPPLNKFSGGAAPTTPSRAQCDRNFQTVQCALVWKGVAPSSLKVCGVRLLPHLAARKTHLLGAVTFGMLNLILDIASWTVQHGNVQSAQAQAEAQAQAHA